MEYLRVRNWEKYQHYKAERPAWIKLYTRLHDDPEYISLEDVGKAHMIGLLLLAGRTGNRIPNNAQMVGRMMHASEPVDLEMWITSGFLVSDCGPKPCINTSPTRAREDKIREEKKDLRAGGERKKIVFDIDRYNPPALKDG